MTILMQIEIRLLITSESGTNTLSIEVSKKNFIDKNVTNVPVCRNTPNVPGTGMRFFHKLQSTEVRSFGTVHTLDLAVSNWH